MAASGRAAHRRPQLMMPPYMTAVPGAVMALMLAFTTLAGCAPAGTGVDDQRRGDAGERHTPGLHTMMVEMAMRHASVWFAGDALNWELADYMVHELEDVAENVGEAYPEYDGIRVASLMAEKMLPAIEEVGGAVDARDHGAFVAAFDRLTTSCNACHAASDRAAIVIQRPTAPPLTNLRYAP
jgi:hypothetical protein